LALHPGTEKKWVYVKSFDLRDAVKTQIEFIVKQICVTEQYRPAGVLRNHIPQSIDDPPVLYRQGVYVIASLSTAALSHSNPSSA
jgi:hypothetical protein